MRNPNNIVIKLETCNTGLSKMFCFKMLAIAICFAFFFFLAETNLAIKAHSKPSQTFKIKIINGFQPLNIFAKMSILDV